MQISARRLRGVAATLIFLFAVSAQAYYPEWWQKSRSSLSELGTIRTGDLNGDGRPDVLARTTFNGVYAMLTNSDGTLGSYIPVYYTGTTVADILLADFNNDGKLDVVIADTGTNSLVALPGNGDGTFAAPVITTLTIAPTELALGDFNGDGHPDVLVRSATGPSFAIFKSDGALQFSLLSSSVALTSSPYRTAVGDVDGDGKTDVVIGLSAPVGLQVHFGKGDGTFDSPVAVAGAPTASSDIALGDLNSDGRVDIVTSQTAANQVNVILNSGGRAFAAAVSYEVRPGPKWYGYPRQVAVLDATDDGKLDVVVILIAEGVVTTLPGNGDGTLGSPQFTYNNRVESAVSMAVADFTSDGRLDLVVAAPDDVLLMRNAPGELTLNINAASPTLSVGQTERFTVRASLPVANFSGFPAPVGTVTVNDGVGSGDLYAGSDTATINSSALSLGSHTLSATYPGNSDYHAAVSNSVSVNVISETTTTTLTSDHAGQAIQYGTQFILTGSVTSPVAGSLYGLFWLYTDGQRSEYAGQGPPATFYSNTLLPGTHSFYITYEGNATQPPSTSNTVTQEIVKANPGIRLAFPTALVTYGQQPNALVYLTPESGATLPTGAVHIYEGRTLVMTTYTNPSSGSTLEFNMAVLPVGVHYLYAVYDGDSNFNPAQSAVAQYSVLANATLTVTAGADPVAKAVGVGGLYNGPGNVYFAVYRRTNSTPWTGAGHWYSPSYTQYNAVAGVVYSFYIEAFDSSNHLLATSNVDSTMLASFTDDPLTVNTSIKAQHLTEILAAVNVFRGAANLQPMVLADIAPGGTIRAAHLTALQNGLNEARTALGSGTITFTGGTPGAPIKAQHVQDLREAIR